MTLSEYRPPSSCAEAGNLNSGTGTGKSRVSSSDWSLLDGELCAVEFTMCAIESTSMVSEPGRGRGRACGEKRTEAGVEERERPK